MPAISKKLKHCKTVADLGTYVDHMHVKKPSMWGGRRFVNVAGKQSTSIYSLMKCLDKISRKASPDQVEALKEIFKKLKDLDNAAEVQLKAQTRFAKILTKLKQLFGHSAKARAKLENAIQRRISQKPIVNETAKSEEGSRAPDFELTSANGQKIRLSDYKGKKAVVLYFYPKDESAICTAEACSFRDSYEDFVAVGAEVIGISDDPVSSHKGFASRHRLPFVLLSDPGGSVREQYGAKKTLGLIPGRITFVIDKNGIIRQRFDSQVRFNAHVATALELLKTI